MLLCDINFKLKVQVHNDVCFPLNIIVNKHWLRYCRFTNFKPSEGHIKLFWRFWIFKEIKGVL